MEVREHVGLVFQDADDQLFSPTVFEDVAFGPLNLGKTRREAEAVVERTLDRLGLGGYERRITHRLSGGEKRLVSLATVLAMEPDVLLLDEPSVGLDEEASARVVEALKALDAAMVVVSQDPDFLSQVTSRRVVLEQGRFV